MTFLNFFSCFLFFSFSSLAYASRDYHEQLVLQPLVPASVLASFNFRSNVSLSSFEEQHFGHFPRSLGQILQHAHTKELHLRFSTGRWDAESWGTRPWDGIKEGGTGVEIWAWVEADTEHEAFARWITLNNALSGLFCASMNFIDSTRTTRPVMTFEPTGDHLDSSKSNLHLLHGTLPREVVCTENLTPFLKLLPCKGKAGIASLLDGHKLFDATWQTMSIDVRPVCSDGGRDCIMEMEQTVDMVVDIERSKRPRADPIPRPLPVENLMCDQTKEYPEGNACYPLDLSEPQMWSLMIIFGRQLKGMCQLQGEVSSEPSVVIKAHNDLEVWTTPGVVEDKQASGLSRLLTIPPSMDFEAEFVVPKQARNLTVPPTVPLLFAERSITGHGQERGGVRALLRNPSQTEAVEFVYFEALPWFMKPYIHTLKAQISGQFVRSEDLIKDMYYRPGLDRSRGSQLELHMTIPAASTVTLTYDFEKAILRYTEYPPDANRGRDVAPAVIRIVSTAQKDKASSYLRTTPLMLPLPTPDFSMPYNVIILTSTVIALAFGTFFNLLVRRFIGVDEAEEGGPKGKIKALVAMLKSKLKKGDVEKKTQ